MVKNSTWPGAPDHQRARLLTTKSLGCLVILMVQALGVCAQGSVSGTVFDEKHVLHRGRHEQNAGSGG
jgi:hypothetical protein